MTVDELLESAAAAYAASLSRFRPWITSYPGNNRITEANLTFHLCQAFRNFDPSNDVWLEREFKCGRASLKLDAYMASRRLAILFEAKCVTDSRPDLELVLKDIERLDNSVAEQQGPFDVGAPPSGAAGLLVAETWKKPVEQWWLRGVGFPNIQSELERRAKLAAEGWIFGSNSVGHFNHGSASPAAGRECMWLYATRSLPGVNP